MGCILDYFDEEECDGLDNNGNGLIDEGFDLNENDTPDCLNLITAMVLIVMEMGLSMKMQTQ